MNFCELLASICHEQVYLKQIPRRDDALKENMPLPVVGKLHTMYHVQSPYSPHQSHSFHNCLCFCMKTQYLSLCVVTTPMARSDLMYCVGLRN